LKAKKLQRQILRDEKVKAAIDQGYLVLSNKQLRYQPQVDLASMAEKLKGRKHTRSTKELSQIAYSGRALQQSEELERPEDEDKVRNAYQKKLPALSGPLMIVNEPRLPTLAPFSQHSPRESTEGGPKLLDFESRTKDGAVGASNDSLVLDPVENQPEASDNPQPSAE